MVAVRSERVFAGHLAGVEPDAATAAASGATSATLGTAPGPAADTTKATPNSSQGTTRTSQWFLERGFRNAAIDDLPQQKQALYNYQRKSNVYRKKL